MLWLSTMRRVCQAAPAAADVSQAGLAEGR